MKVLFLVCFVLPALFLMLGYTDSTGHNSAVAEFPKEQRPQYPILLQVKHNDFPFDVNGKFPFVVMVDNVVWTYDRETVVQFLEKGTPNRVGHGRSRVVTN